MNTQDYLIQDSKAHIAKEMKKQRDRQHLERLLREWRISEFNKKQEQAVNRARILS